MKNRKIKHIRKILCGFLCTVIAVSPAVSASAAEYDEYGAPIVTATPTPVPHTEYYEQAPDTDSIEGRLRDRKSKENLPFWWIW